MPKAAPKLKPVYKSSIEEKTARQLAAEGIHADYEGVVLLFTIPAFDAKYHPDFPIRNSNIVIECKGRFGDRWGGGAEVRQRLILVKEQHPELDIRILFDKKAADIPIYKKSKTTQGKWATDHGFKWASGAIPPEWIKEMKPLGRDERQQTPGRSPKSKQSSGRRSS